MFPLGPFAFQSTPSPDQTTPNFASAAGQDSGSFLRFSTLGHVMHYFIIPSDFIGAFPDLHVKNVRLREGWTDLAPMTKLARVFAGAGGAEAVWSCDASAVLRQCCGRSFTFLLISEQFGISSLASGRLPPFMEKFLPKHLQKMKLGNSGKISETGDGGVKLRGR
jgi:hypothetical protein